MTTDPITREDLEMAAKAAGKLAAAAVGRAM